MKTYQNPQPYAVERINKIQNKPNAKESTKHEIKTKNLISEESEEQAWRDVLEKDKSHKNT